jgi:hypothetical protein
MTSSDKNEVAADFSDLLTELSGPQAIQHRARLLAHLRALETRLGLQAASGQTNLSWVRLQAARTAVREALEILEALPPPPT